MYVAQLAQTEPVSPRGIHVSIHCHDGARGGHFKGLPDLNVHLEVGDGAPVVGSWSKGKNLM